MVIFFFSWINLTFLFSVFFCVSLPWSYSTPERKVTKSNCVFHGILKILMSLTHYLKCMFLINISLRKHKIFYDIIIVLYFWYNIKLNLCLAYCETFGDNWFFISFFKKICRYATRKYANTFLFPLKNVVILPRK